LLISFLDIALQSFQIVSEVNIKTLAPHCVNPQVSDGRTLML